MVEHGGLVCVTRLDLYKRPDYFDGGVLSFIDVDEVEVVAPRGGNVVLEYEFRTS